MKSKIINIVGSAGIILFALSVAILDFANMSFKNNWLGYALILLSTFFIGFYLYGIRKESKLEVMPSKNEKTNFIGLMGIFLAVNAITIFDFTNMEGYKNLKAYIFAILSLILIVFYFYKLYSERNLKN
jgi:drug/metabolite transporter (DMT)-like permease